MEQIPGYNSMKRSNEPFINLLSTLTSIILDVRHSHIMQVHDVPENTSHTETQEGLCSFPENKLSVQNCLFLFRSTERMFPEDKFFSNTIFLKNTLQCHLVFNCFIALKGKEFDVYEG